MLFCAANAWGAAATNQIVSLAMEAGTAAPTLLVQTSEPVGYRYTVYDSFDPVRVVIDFPGMSLADVPAELTAGPAPLQRVRAATYELATGSLARVEVVLTSAADYQVSQDGTSFRLSFPALAVAPVAAVTSPMADAAARTGSVATVVREVSLSGGQALFVTNGPVERVENFVLANPPRLVVDLYGVTPTFKSRVFNATGGMKQLRIGAYADKVRGVFDADGQALPPFTVEKQADGVAVAWNRLGAPVTAAAALPASAVEPVAAPVAEPKKKGPVSARQVTIDKLDFSNSDGRSFVTLGLSAPAKVSAPKLDGKLLRFEISNATISRSLRRTIDASAFPSAVATVTPYLFTDQGKQGVRIAVELKGPVAYALEDDGELVKLVIEDGAFAEALPPAVTTQELFVAPAIVSDSLPGGLPKEDGVSGRFPAATAAKPLYTGQKISLVFDDADIRSIIQLIGDVSDLNILVNNDVKGNITLRLIDVPWDQALDLVLQTADLGKIQEGNVVRIMPAKKLRELELAGMQAIKEDTADGVLETRVFEISYAAINDVVKNLSPMKSPRGTITPDTRSKQVIISDVARVLSEMEKMIKMIDRPERQVLIEARIVEVNTNFARDLGVRWGFTYRDEPNGDDLENAAIGLGGSFLITPPGAGGLGTSAGATMGLLFGLLDGNANLAVRLSALETQGEGKIISTPRVTTLNGQKAVISQGTKIPYTVTSDAGADTKFESAELKLEVTPEINPDGSIIMDVKASNSSVGDVVPQASGGSAISINERKAETKVIVRDGTTTVLGGIFVEEERESDTGVPLLKDIPFLGHLFKSSSKSSSRKEILIFITPRIIEI
jgi:type IV pilus assembly protein PilQ